MFACDAVKPLSDRSLHASVPMLVPRNLRQKRTERRDALCHVGTVVESRDLDENFVVSPVALNSDETPRSPKSCPDRFV